MSRSDVTRPPRSAAIDAVRICGMFAVVAGHVWANNTGAPNTIRLLVYSWLTPLFFFLMGYLWKTGRTLRSEVVTRARSVLVPYACWIVILEALAVAVQLHRGTFSLSKVGAVLWSGYLAPAPFIAFWFVPVLFFVAVLLRFLERVPRPISWLVALLGLAAFSLAGDVLRLAPEGILTAAPCLLFALAGQEVKRRVRSRGALDLLVCAALLGLAVTALLTRIVAPLDIKAGDFGTPILSVLLATIICTALVKGSEAVFAGRPVAWITELGTTSFAILLLHYSVLQVMLGLGQPAWAAYLTALVAAWSVGLVLHRTPLSQPLIGVPQRRRGDPFRGPVVASLRLN